MAMTRKEMISRDYTLHSSIDNKWFKVTQKATGDEGVLLCQSKHKWHFFWSRFEASASGNSPDSATNGSIGDVIGTDGEERSYKRIMLDAPDCYMAQCDGLYRCSSQVYNA
jgi:hypothetical protein